MTSVPNWIAKAFVYTPRFGHEGTVRAITGWRATATQVIVTVNGSRGPMEMRFRLADLRQIGQPSWQPLRVRLLPPDAPEVATAMRAEAVVSAVDHVLTSVERQRLHDSHSDDADTAANKLIALRAAVDEALAMLGPVL